MVEAHSWSNSRAAELMWECAEIAMRAVRRCLNFVIAVTETRRFVIRFRAAILSTTASSGREHPASRARQRQCQSGRNEVVDRFSGKPERARE